MKSRPALDWVNFLIADVKDGLGPFLAIYLMSCQHWDSTYIGVIMMIGGLATVAARAPAGALVDWTMWKRSLIVGAAGVVAVGAVALSIFPRFWPAAAAQTLIGACDAVFPPAIAAISLGIVGRRAFTRRVGRNEAFNHAGNAFTAIVAGVAGYLIAPGAVLWLVALLAAASACAALAIDAREIDHTMARGSDEEDDGKSKPRGLRVIFECKPLLFFTAAITLFHFANAAMLPLIGERLSQGQKGAETLFMAACIITAQIAMVPMAMLVGAKADAWGRKPLFLVGFAVLPIRGVLYTLWSDPYYLVSIQLLDGIGAGIFGALFFIVIADLTKGTGHYNLALGAASAAWGLGAALSNSVAGFIVDRAGFNAAFLFLATMASLAFLLFWLAVPDTGERSKAVEADTDKSEARNAPAHDLGRLPAIETRPSQCRVKEPASRKGKPKSHSFKHVATALILLGVFIALGIYAARVFDIRLPATQTLWDDGTTTMAIAIFAATYLVIAIGKLPGYHLDRTGAALLGASLMVGLGIVSLDQAYRAIDFDTIALLLGMMIVVANLRLSGFFRLVSNWVVMRAHHPLTLLAAIVLVAGSFSAFLVNDTICLVMTPLVLELVTRLKRDPIPYLLAVPMASNIGSTATITGNPQNMIIGSLSHIPYGTFAAALWPVAAVGLILTALFIALIYRREFMTRERLPAVVVSPARYHGPLVIKSVLVAAAMVVLFFAGQPVAKVAIIGGALLLFNRRLRADRVYREIDWPLLVMFVGLFIVVTGLETTVLTPDMIAAVGRLHLDTVPVLSAVTAGLSNLVSNVPAVLVLKPFVANLRDPQRAWLIVSMASTLAGNLTLVGSVANLIVAQRARAHNVTIGFWEYFKVGAPLTMLTILFGAWWL
jgi:Na+/H+ antiporter NhaD/arsenite permease-like protein/predicted MFS family arabinose efflux permease